MLVNVRFILIACVALASLQTASAELYYYYSPADSILYAQYALMDDEYITIRLQNGGATYDVEQNLAPGWIHTTDNIAGHVWAVGLGPTGWDVSSSVDGGKEWIPCLSIQGCDGNPDYGNQLDINSRGYPGANPGESSLKYGFRDSVWIHTTADSWQTFQSTLVSTSADTVQFYNVTYQTNVLLGTSCAGHNLSLSTDTGRTWAVGSRIPLLNSEWSLRAGAPDEIWGRLGKRVYVALDTGRVIRDSVFVAHPPRRDCDWSLNLRPTDHPGEAYLVAEQVYWTDPLDFEFIIYHIYDYGSRVDSFYKHVAYRESSVHTPYLPKSLRVSAYPNPFNSSVAFQWESGQGLPHDIIVSDLLGRKVWEWQGNANHTLWNGVSSQGIVLPSGKYWATIKQGSQTQTTLPVVIIR